MTPSLQHIGPAVRRATAYGAGAVALGTMLTSKFALSVQRCAYEAIGVVAFSTFYSGVMETVLNVVTAGRESARIGIDTKSAGLKSLAAFAGIGVYKWLLLEWSEDPPREDLPYVATKLMAASGALLISFSYPCASACPNLSDDPPAIHKRTVCKTDRFLKGIGIGAIGFSAWVSQSSFAAVSSTLGAVTALMLDPVTRLGKFGD